MPSVLQRNISSFPSPCSSVPAEEGKRKKEQKKKGTVSVPAGCRCIPAFVPEGMQKGRISRMKDVFAQRRSIHRVWKKNAQMANFGHSG